MVIKVVTVLKDSLAISRFPAFCGTLVGGYTILQWAFRVLYDYAYIDALSRHAVSKGSCDARLTVSRFLAALISAWFSLRLLNLTKHHDVDERKSKKLPHEPRVRDDDALLQAEDRAPLTIRSLPSQTKIKCQLAGKTIDLTVLAVARAVDTIIINVWRQMRPATSSRRPTSKITHTISKYADTLVFVLGSGTIMWAWFYLPDKLPHAYNKWIGQAAQVDPRLLVLLQEARAGKMIYGKDTGLAPILQDMCKEYKWPLVWGDPAQTVPIPCELVHMGTGPNCHWHAAVRFGRAFNFAMATYLPLQLFIKGRNPSATAFSKAIKEAVRSSAFLGAFVGLFYYGVCLSRTCLGPRLFGSWSISPLMWDSGLCVRAGCVLCGWSILLEAEKRRQELAMFVAPRALATLLPRNYDVRVRGLSFEFRLLNANIGIVSLERKGSILC